jgi:hypothetical protein
METKFKDYNKFKGFDYKYQYGNVIIHSSYDLGKFGLPYDCSNEVENERKNVIGAGTTIGIFQEDSLDIILEFIKDVNVYGTDRTLSLTTAHDIYFEVDDSMHYSIHEPIELDNYTLKVWDKEDRKIFKKAMKKTKLDKYVVVV